MSEQMTEPGSSTPLNVEEAAVKKQEIPSHHDSSAIETRTNAANGLKRKKGRRKSGTKKHRAGRNQKRKYKPYHRLSFAERQKVDERNAKRNFRKRQFLRSCGVSLAPQNTNQFLFDDRVIRKSEEIDNSDPSSLSEYDGSNSEGDDFNVMWHREKRQRFERMTRDELIEWFMNLEDEIVEAEKRLEEITKIRIYQEEVRKYETANEELANMNARLTKMLEDMTCKVEKDINKKDQPIENDLSADINTAE
ncbi:protein HEXIM2-like [Argiope bruennichi]|uniref:Protein HEXIM2 like protein n=1 Tax=Argiope bruennichi TaxID=94029 RepID=A0A8T0FA41_ARGBR|nr:protein HEXIM2-like [Argiope bruennichi]KAF8786319.1 Protein HEXIM2 like protein [Argiope bruennichi]